VTQEGGELQLHLPLRGRKRLWTIQAHDRAEAITAVDKPVDPALLPERGFTPPPLRTPLPQSYLIKYDDFPLDRVKDSVLTWGGDDRYPHLFLTRAELSAYRKSFTAEPDLLARYRTAPVLTHELEGPLSCYLGCGNPGGDDHSLLTSPEVPPMTTMQVKAFSAGDEMDYHHGTRAVWDRQLVFLKSTDPLGPNYFALLDALGGKAPGTWRLWLVARKVTVEGATAHVGGREEVDLDLFFAAPRAVNLTTQEKTRPCLGMNAGDAVTSAMSNTQTAVIAEVKKGESLLVVMYPRVNVQEAPTITALADGRGVKVQTSVGTDYVFVSAAPFTYKDAAIAFRVTVGTIRVRGKEHVLVLGAAGSISFAGRALEAEKAATRCWQEGP
jgi:hypothetical protein